MPFWPTGQSYNTVAGSPIGLGAIALTGGLDGSARGRGAYVPALDFAFWAGYDTTTPTNSDFLVVLDVSTYTQQSSAPYTYAGATLYSCAFNPVTGFLYVLCTIGGAGRVLKIVPATGAIAATINLPAVMLGDILYCESDDRIYCCGGTGRLVAISTADVVDVIVNLGGNILSRSIAHVLVNDRIFMPWWITTTNTGGMLYYEIGAGTFTSAALPVLNDSITSARDIAYSVTAEQCIVGIDPPNSTFGVDYYPMLDFDPVANTYAVNTALAEGFQRSLGLTYLPASDQFYCNFAIPNGYMTILDAGASGFGTYDGAVAYGSTSNEPIRVLQVNNLFFIAAQGSGSIAVFQAP